MKEDLKKLQEILCLKEYPKVIEGYDIANLGNLAPVGAKVTFIDGLPFKPLYRKYHIKSVEGQNDFAMMEEILERRLRSQDKDPLPNLILIDGGKGQVSSATKVLSRLDLSTPLIGLAKKNEILIQPLSFEEICLPHTHPALRMLVKIRNEVHRFVNTFHKQTRQKQTIKSLFDSIPGIGKVRKESLIQNFASIENLKNASLEEIEQKTQFPPSICKKILHYINNLS